MKKMILFVLICIMLFTNGVGMLVFAAEATATTLRLESVEGTVTIENKRGISRKPIKESKLYSGDTITTGLSSYAYISLDDDKVVKIDANSKVEMKQSGKKLEVYLISGELFFNVEKPLKSDETLSIRTSTMSTGIRGTSGFLKVHNEVISQVSLLTGVVTVHTSDISNHPEASQRLTAGNTASSTREISGES